MRSEKLCIVDSNGYTYLAEVLAPFFEHPVSYWSPWISAFPEKHLNSVGSGIPNVNRIHDYMTTDCEYFLFTDLCYSEQADKLRTEGKFCYGASPSEILELDRELFFKTLGDVGLNTVSYERVKGVQALTDNLKNKKDKYVKCSLYRGNFETFHWREWKLDHDILTELQYELEGQADDFVFLICDPINADIEFGMTSDCVYGQFPKKQSWEIEVKDTCLLFKVCEDKDIPKPIRTVNEKFSPILKEWNHLGNFSTEIRWTPKSYTFTDAVVARYPEPPGGLKTGIIENIADIIIEGAKGILIEPIYKAKYGCQINLYSSTVGKHGMNIEIPKEFQPYIRLKNYYKKKDLYWTVAFKKVGSPEMNIFGNAIYWDNDLDKAIEGCTKAAESILCRDYTFAGDSVDKAKKLIEELKVHNIIF